MAEPTSIATLKEKQAPAANLPIVGFNPDAYHAMQERDAMLIRDEVLHGYTGKEYVYDFEVAGTKVRGVSAIGSRALASFYGGIQSRLIASIDKTGALFVCKGFEPFSVHAQIVRELAEEEDFYEVLMEVTDIKTGNRTQVRKKEYKREYSKAKKQWYERPHYDTIAESKAKRNGILELVPQDVIQRFIELCVKQGNTKTEKTLDQLRAGALAFASKNAIPLDRDALGELTYDQIFGMGQAAQAGVAQFKESVYALGLARAAEPKEEAAKERPNVE